MQSYEVRLLITYKDSVPDTNALGILNGLRSLGLAEGVIKARTGKIIDLLVDAEPDKINDTVADMCRQLLAHPTVEQWQHRLLVRYGMYRLPLAPEQPIEITELADHQLHILLYSRPEAVRASHGVVKLIAPRKGLGGVRDTPSAAGN